MIFYTNVTHLNMSSEIEVGKWLICYMIDVEYYYSYCCLWNSGSSGGSGSGSYSSSSRHSTVAVTVAVAIVVNLISDQSIQKHNFN